MVIDPRRDLLTGQHGAGGLEQLLAQQRRALDDEVDLAGGQRLHAGLDRVDGDDLDVLARHLAGRLDGLDGAQTHVVVVGVDQVDVRVGWPGSLP